jgi:hypothetical protein
MQHPKTIALRSVEGGNNVDEGESLAQDDVKRRWPIAGASGCWGETEGWESGKVSLDPYLVDGMKKRPGACRFVGST